MGQPNRWEYMALVALLAFGSGAIGQSLSGRLNSTRGERTSVQEELRETKSEQQARRDRLSKAQVVANRAKSAYRAAHNKLEGTRQRLRESRKQHDACVARLKAHDATVSQRVTLMYEMGEPSYVEVLLDSTTFSDFVERADYMERVVRHDADVLVSYTGAKREAEALRNQLEVTQAKEEQQARELNQKKAQAESKAAYAETLLRESNKERAKLEQELAELERVEKQISELIARIQSGRGSGGYTGKWDGWGSAPIRASHRLTSPFGMRFHPILRCWKAHKGVDLACPTGTPIYAAAPGRVITAGWRSVLGNAVIIDHGGGWSTVYGHCSRVAVSSGQNVKSGQVVGYVGSTGRSTGPHLHFGVRKNGVCVDPRRAGAY